MHKAGPTVPGPAAPEPELIEEHEPTGRAFTRVLAESESRCRGIEKPGGRRRQNRDRHARLPELGIRIPRVGRDDGQGRRPGGWRREAPRGPEPRGRTERLRLPGHRDRRDLDQLSRPRPRRTPPKADPHARAEMANALNPDSSQAADAAVTATATQGAAIRDEQGVPAPRAPAAEHHGDIDKRAASTFRKGRELSSRAAVVDHTPESARQRMPAQSTGIRSPREGGVSPLVR